MATCTLRVPLLYRTLFRRTTLRCLSTSSFSNHHPVFPSTLTTPTTTETGTATVGLTPASANRELDIPPLHPLPRWPPVARFPKRIILIRHGESLGNVDETLYAEIPDWKIPLTRRGERQCIVAAHDLYTLTKGESIFCYCSPYKRTRETWDIISTHLAQQSDVELIGVREEPRIAEQQFGNFQNPRKVRTAKAERRTFGRFFFRFPNGEAGLDVYNRVSSFLATLSRDLLQFQDSGADMTNLNVVICTHGLTMRLLLMRYFQLSVEDFERSFNPQNAKLVVMDRIEPTEDLEDPSSKAGSRKPFFRLAEEAKEALNLHGDVSSEKPVFFRGDALDQIPYDLQEEV